MPLGSGRTHTDLGAPAIRSRFATPADLAECRRLHRKYGTTYFFASQRFHAPIRDRVHALYGFVRVPDEWVDNPAAGSRTRPASRLKSYRNDFLRGLDGVCPEEPVLRAFCDVVHEVRMPLEEPLLFLDAMAQDLSVTRYESYEDLQGYMRGSAAAVGVMMCSVLEAGWAPDMLAGARALGEAMQLTNFLRDIREDLERGRIYLPQEDLRRFGVSEEELAHGAMSDRFRALMAFEIDRARQLYRRADIAIPALPREARKPVRLARVLYSGILESIERNGYDVFTRRARTTKLEKAGALLKILASRG